MLNSIDFDTRQEISELIRDINYKGDHAGLTALEHRARRILTQIKHS